MFTFGCQESRTHTTTRIAPQPVTPRQPPSPKQQHHTSTLATSAPPPCTACPAVPHRLVLFLLLSLSVAVGPSRPHLDPTLELLQNLPPSLGKPS